MTLITARIFAISAAFTTGLICTAASAAPLEIKGLTVGATETAFVQGNKGAECGDSVAPTDSLKGKWPVRSCHVAGYTLASFPATGNFLFYPGGWGSLLLSFDGDNEVDLLMALASKYGKPEAEEPGQYRWQFDDARMVLRLTGAGSGSDYAHLSVSSKLSADWDRKHVEALAARAANDL